MGTSTRLLASPWREAHCDISRRNIGKLTFNKENVMSRFCFIPSILQISSVILVPVRRLRLLPSSAQSADVELVSLIPVLVKGWLINQLFVFSTHRFMLTWVRKADWSLLHR